MCTVGDGFDGWMPDWYDPEWFYAGGADLRLDEFLNVSEEHQAKLVESLSELIDGDRERGASPNPKQASAGFWAASQPVQLLQSKPRWIRGFTTAGKSQNTA